MQHDPVAQGLFNHSEAARRCSQRLARLRQPSPSCLNSSVYRPRFLFLTFASLSH
jgi:hypothetical protein